MRIAMVALALSVCTAPQACRAETPDRAPTTAGLPAPLAWQNATADWSVDKKGAFTLAAGKKTDWFVWPGGGDYRPDSSPRALFKTEENFSFSTRVDVTAHAIYDAGCIALVGTAARWAKFCLEAQADGGLAIVSVVTRDLSDDTTSYPVTGTSTWLKVAKDQRASFSMRRPMVARGTSSASSASTRPPASVPASPCSRRKAMAHAPCSATCTTQRGRSISGSCVSRALIPAPAPSVPQCHRRRGPCTTPSRATAVRRTRRRRRG